MTSLHAIQNKGAHLKQNNFDDKFFKEVENECQAKRHDDPLKCCLDRYRDEDV